MIDILQDKIDIASYSGCVQISVKSTRCTRVRRSTCIFYIFSTVAWQSSFPCHTRHHFCGRLATRRARFITSRGHCSRFIASQERNRGKFVIWFPTSPVSPSTTTITTGSYVRSRIDCKTLCFCLKFVTFIIHNSTHQGVP